MAQATDSNREFECTDADFEKVRRLIYDRVGISLTAVKRDMVYSRLARRLRALGMHRFKDYLAHLEGAHDPTEWEAFTNALTTNLTSFFREAHHFEILREHMDTLRGRGDLSIWCSAASTGEEPYSLAITMADLYKSVAPPVSITATDVDTQVLKKAQAGIYTMERIERLPAEQTRRYFLKGEGDKSGFVRVRPELQRLIEFGQLNLLDTHYWVNGPFDAIFCRNVLIYFDKPTQAAILRKMEPLLKPRGLLFVGHSESLFHVADIFKLRGKTVYERVAKTLRAEKAGAHV
ncbi:MAG: CheR family methyltransferase [Burkholderiales bacterium]